MDGKACRGKLVQKANPFNNFLDLQKKYLIFKL